jgi:hypothetical protein
VLKHKKVESLKSTGKLKNENIPKLHKNALKIDIDTSPHHGPLDKQARDSQGASAQPQIGFDLDEHLKASGGITDLRYGGIVIELKPLPAGVKVIEDC